MSNLSIFISGGALGCPPPPTSNTAHPPLPPRRVRERRGPGRRAAAARDARHGGRRRRGGPLQRGPRALGALQLSTGAGRKTGRVGGWGCEGRGLAANPCAERPPLRRLRRPKSGAGFSGLACVPRRTHSRLYPSTHTPPALYPPTPPTRPQFFDGELWYAVAAAQAPSGDSVQGLSQPGAWIGAYDAVFGAGGAAAAAGLGARGAPAAFAGPYGRRMRRI